MYGSLRNCYELGISFLHHWHGTFFEPFGCDNLRFVITRIGMLGSVVQVT